MLPLSVVTIGDVKYTNGMDDTLVANIYSIDEMTLRGHIFDSGIHAVYAEIKQMYLEDFLACISPKSMVIPTLPPPHNVKAVSHIVTYVFVKEIQQRQQRVWDAEEALIQNAKEGVKSMQHVRSALESHLIYSYLFTIMKNRYEPLKQFNTRLGMTVTYLKNIESAKVVDILRKRDSMYDDSGETEAKLRQRVRQFHRRIAPLLSKDVFLVESIRQLRTKILKDASNNENTFANIFALRVLIRDINIYIQIQTESIEMDINSELKKSVLHQDVNKFCKAMKDYDAQQARGRKDVPVMFTANALIDPELISEIKTSSARKFNTNIGRYFLLALHEYYTTTGRGSTMIMQIYNEISTKTSVVHLLRKDLQTKKTDLKAYIEEVTTPRSPIPPGLRGGYLENKKYYLFVYNTETLQKLRKRIFQNGKQMRVRHNNQLLLVSKYKMMLAKRHNGRVQFEIRRRK
jgi:hypothetical protein